MCKLADNCKYGSLCPYLYDAPGVTVTGCSRYKENKPLTNADRIRSMTDEELAEMIANHVYGMECQNCPACDFCNPCMEDTTCRSTLLDWLKQEVTE